MHVFRSSCAFSSKVIDTLSRCIDIFEQQHIPWQVSGGFAGKLYGSPRPLNDIDFDVPDEFLPYLSNVFKHYIEFYGQYQNEKWDTPLLRLNMDGQMVDIGGGRTAKHSDKKFETWLSCATDWDNYVNFDVGELRLRVCPPRELAAYKIHLTDRSYQHMDVNAALAFADKYSL